jgi:hypothetical protein
MALTKNGLLAYKPNLTETLPLLRRFYERKAEDKIFAAFVCPNAALEKFGRRYSHDFCEYPDPNERVEFWDNLFRERATLCDDSIPSAYLSEFDQGLYGGLLGGKPTFMAHPENGWISSMVAPLLKDWDDFKTLKIEPDHLWFERYRNQLDLFTRIAKGKFGISHFICIDSLNFVFELFGATQTYMSVIDYPEKVRKAVDFAFELNTTVQNMFFEHVGMLEGGTCSNMAQWIPGRIISESVDPFHMTAVDYFEQWGWPPIDRIFSQFDGGVIHIHGNGRHLLEAVSRLKGLKAIAMLDDR